MVKRIGFVIFLVYAFLVSIRLMGTGFQNLGGDFARILISTTNNPFAGLFIGILATSIVQSSSCVTSLVVGLVGAGSLTLPNAIPIIMGANIGTTVTNILVSLAHITRREEFSRAFAGAVVHDMFKLLAVAVFFPLELVTHYLEKSSLVVAHAFAGVGGIKILNPLKLCVQPCVKVIVHFLHSPVLIAIGGLVLLFVSLIFIVKEARLLTVNRAERFFDEYLFNKPLKSFAFGAGLTAIVQSSSVTTSLAVPLVGAKILTVEKVFPYFLGADVGTTVTAILAALVTAHPLAIAVAMTHLFFNLSGIVVFYPLRFVPIKIAKSLGLLVGSHRSLAIFYIIILFFIIPFILILLWQ